MMSEEKTKSFAVSKEMVYNSYLKVCSKDGAAAGLLNSKLSVDNYIF